MVDSTLINLCKSCHDILLPETQHICNICGGAPVFDYGEGGEELDNGEGYIEECLEIYSFCRKCFDSELVDREEKFIQVWYPFGSEKLPKEEETFSFVSDTTARHNSQRRQQANRIAKDRAKRKKIRRAKQ